MTQSTHAQSGFASLGVSPRILEILEEQKFTVPTPIQHQSIPAGIEGKDIIGIAQTGTGKTLASGIPMIQRIGKEGFQGLVIVPTRELALQVNETLHRVGESLGLGTCVLIGGESMRRQMDDLRRNPHVLVATPGRLLDHLEQKTVDLSTIGILVLDEADRMLDMGFAPQINRILQNVPLPKDRQTMLFSATMPDGIVSIATRHMALPVRVEVAPQGTAAEQVEQEIFIVRKEAKMDLLEQLLLEHTGTVLVFSRTKYGAAHIAQILKRKGEHAIDIHSNRSLAQRIKALDGFKTGKYRVLVATDIAARGIDVTGITLVVNYDLPDNAEDYVHRIGRTGRAGAEGKAISLATPDQRQEIRTIERLIRKTLPLKRHESVSEILFSMEHMPQRRAGGGGAFRGRASSGPRRGGFSSRAGSSGPRKPRFYR